MTTQYIELVSNYRNRTLYPSPAEFIVELSQTGQSQALNAKDPVSSVAPVETWNSSFNEASGATTVAITGVATNNSTSDSLVLLINASAGELRTIKNYYNGAILILTDGISTVRTRILSYSLVTATQAEIVVVSGVSLNLTSVTGTIQNPTNNTATAIEPKIFIPSGVSGNNFYRDYYVGYLSSSNTYTYRKIVYYDGTTHLATLKSATPTSWLLTNGNFIIRKMLPTNNGTTVAMNNVASVGTTTTSALANGLWLQLANTASGNSNEYAGGFIRILAPVPVAPFSTNVAPYNETKRITKYIAGDGTFRAINNLSNTFSLDWNASSIDGFYVGAIIKNVTTGEYRQIASYSGSTRSGTVAVNWGGGVPGNVWNMRTVMISDAFSVALSTATEYEIEQFTRDNYNPFAYSGSMISVSQEICYEVELVNLILPNITLESGRGGRAIFYPFLYVELQCVSSPGSGVLNMIYSNNPNATKALFRAVVDDTTQPTASPFIKIDSDGQVQTVKFKPNTALKFRIFHSDGQLFKTVEPDFYSPIEPNPLVQISALFSFKRVSSSN